MTMVQQVEVLVATADGLGSIPGTYTVKGETQLPKVILRPPHERTHMQETNIYKEKLGVI